MNKPCVGFLEFSSIARGIEAVDALLKKATVRILISQPVSSGKYITMFDGEVEDVKCSFSEGMRVGSSSVIDSFVIPNITPAVVDALQTEPSLYELESLGILETSSCATCIEAVDNALKIASVTLIKIHLAKGIAGNAYFVINGEVGDVEAGMRVAVRTAKRKNTLLENIIIPKATPDILQAFRPAIRL